MPLDLPAMSIRPEIIKLVEVACDLVDAQAYMRPDELPPHSWAELVKAVANYRVSIDPDAAKRNRDEHGPDIPTDGLDWRSKL